MCKEIKFQFAKIFNNDNYFVRISKQTHKKDEFGKNSYIFQCKNGYSLESCANFSVNEFADKEIYVKGNNDFENKYSKKIVITEKQMQILKECEKEYNEYWKSKSENENIEYCIKALNVFIKLKKDINIKDFYFKADYLCFDFKNMLNNEKVKKIIIKNLKVFFDNCIKELN